MNRTLLLFCLSFYFSLCHSQHNDGAVLVYDTIRCDAFKVIVQLPEASVKGAKTFHYEEGFFKTYSLVQYPKNTFDYLEIHYGTMNRSAFLSEPRDSMCRRDIGNGGVSTKIFYNNTCSRQDYYSDLWLTITYGYYHIDGFIPYGNSAIADKIMDSIIIIKAIEGTPVDDSEMMEKKIDRVLFDGGYAKATRLGPTTYGFSLYYYNQDHLGNNREVVSASGTVQQLTRSTSGRLLPKGRKNYYPFGAPYADPAAVVWPDLQSYKYNGKELDRMHGLNTYDYGARQYDPILGRWDRMDPLCEKYYSISPSWEKTSMEFKHSQAAYAASSLNKERKIGNEEINLFVDRLNNAFEGYSFFSNNGGSVDASYMIPPLVVEPSK